MPDTRKALGHDGESAALVYLNDIGYRLLERNHRLRSAEIDLVLVDDETLVFCEVKTRKGGGAALSYSSAQGKRLRALILKYLTKSAWMGPVRVDFLALDRVAKSNLYSIEHFKDALSFEDNW